MIFRQCFNRTHDLIFWPLSFINKLATINRYNDEFRSDTFPYTPSILPTWRVAEWWIYTCPTDDLLPYRKSYADVGQVSCESKLHSVVRSSMPRKLGGNEACGRVFCPGCHTYLVQELNVGIVTRNCTYSGFSKYQSQMILFH